MPPGALDPLGIVALATILKGFSGAECSCELKCVCDQKCSCELKCVSDQVCSCELKCVCDFQCSCELKCVCDEKGFTSLSDMVSNPVFREVVRGLDPEKVRTIEDFLEIVDDLRAKIAVPKRAAPAPAAPPPAPAKRTRTPRKRGGTR